MKSFIRYIRIVQAIIKAISFDVAIGILAAHFLPMFFSSTTSVAENYFWAITFSLLPDIDTLFHLRKGNFFADHRSWPHYPSLMLPLVLSMVGIVTYFKYGHLNFLYIMLALVGLVWHYLHDSWDNEENKEGIQWGAPFFTYNRYVIYIRPKHEVKKSWLILTRAFARRVANKTIKRIKEKRETALEFWEKHYMKENLEDYQGVIILLVTLIVAWIG